MTRPSVLLLGCGIARAYTFPTPLPIDLWDSGHALQCPLYFIFWYHIEGTWRRDLFPPFVVAAEARLFSFRPTFYHLAKASCCANVQNGGGSWKRQFYFSHHNINCKEKKLNFLHHASQVFSLKQMESYAVKNGRERCSLPKPFRCMWCFVVHQFPQTQGTAVVVAAEY